MLVYLSGAIEQAPDLGKAWRAELTPFLAALGHDVYDPALDERKSFSEQEFRELADFRQWKRTDLSRFQQTMRRIIAYDLEMVERSDYLICLWDEHAQRGAGTQAELTFAHRLGKPVWMVTAMPVEQVSGWLLGCSTAVFTSFADLRSELSRAYPANAVAQMLMAVAGAANAQASISQQNNIPPSISRSQEDHGL